MYKNKSWAFQTAVGVGREPCSHASLLNILSPHRHPQRFRAIDDKKKIKWEREDNSNRIRISILSLQVLCLLCLTQNNIWARREFRNYPSCVFYAELHGALVFQRDALVMPGKCGRTELWLRPSQFHFYLFSILVPYGEYNLTKIFISNIATAEGFKISDLVYFVHFMDETQVRLCSCPWSLLVSHRL